MSSQFVRQSSLSSDAAHAPANFVARAPGKPARRALKATRLRPALCDLADGQLVTLALNGEAKAFPQLMARYGDKVRGIIFKRVPFPEEASELVQDTLLSAWSALQTYPASRPFETWLVCIALNKCRDWGRRRMVRRKSAIYLPELYADFTPGADSGMADQERTDGLERAMAALPATLREPLALTALQQLSQKQAAERLGITVKSVETRVRRAKQHLREALMDTAS